MLYHSKRKREKKFKQKLAARYDLSGTLTHFAQACQLLYAEPKWGPILRECVILGNETKNKDKFAGAWVIQALRIQGVTPPSNLRTLSALGLLKMVHTTRSGNRAYYTMPDSKSITKALKEFGY